MFDCYSTQYPAIKTLQILHFKLFSFSVFLFFGGPHLATCIFLFSNEPELGAGIDPVSAETFS